jgi:hypothetical protein
MRSWEEEGGWGEETRGGISVCDYKSQAKDLLEVPLLCTSRRRASTKKYFNATRLKKNLLTL